ncbi:MAG: glycosyltransferase [Cyanobacteriota bacterium]
MITLPAKASKPKCLYLGHFFHSKTKSTDFLKDHIRQHYTLDEILVDPDSTSLAEQLNQIPLEEASLIILFQVEFILPMIYRRCRKVICVPMYDACGSLPDSYFRMMSGSAIINFSSNLHIRCLGLGLNSFYLKFYPPLADRKRSPSVNHRPKVFFWHRNDQITLSDVIRCFPPNRGFGIHLHWARDDGKEMDPNSMRLLKTYADHTLSFWFDKKDEMIECMESCDLFFAPRLSEGIGMGFLDAMAHGLIPVAFDLPTHNEYIINYYNGFLVNKVSGPVCVDSKTIEQARVIVRQFVSIGREAFERSIESLNSFISDYMCSKQVLAIESVYPFDPKISHADIYRHGHGSFVEFLVNPRESNPFGLADFITACSRLGLNDQYEHMLNAVEKKPINQRLLLYMAGCMLRHASTPEGQALIMANRVKTQRFLRLIKSNLILPADSSLSIGISKIDSTLGSDYEFAEKPPISAKWAN